MQLIDIKVEYKLKILQKQTIQMFNYLVWAYIFFPTCSIVSTLPFVHGSSHAQSIFWLLHFKR